MRDCDEMTVLSNLEIGGGGATSYATYRGVLIDGSASSGGPFITGCWIHGFSTAAPPNTTWGAGILVNAATAQVWIRGCTIEHNETSGEGGGIAVSWSSEVLIEECVLRDNRCGGSGGGLYAQGLRELVMRARGSSVTRPGTTAAPHS